MIRTNLSTRPFYNERAVYLALALAALVVLVLTSFNAIRIISLSRQNTEFSTRINRDRGETQRLTAEAARIRAGMNQEELQATAAAAAGANSLIEQRTFSWTEFFNRIEETLPPDVMLTTVQPSFDQDVPIVQMTAIGRRSEDVEEFIDKLEATGAFSNVLPEQTDPTDEGLHRVHLRAVYSRVAAATPVETKEAAPAQGAPPSEGAAPAGTARGNMARASVSQTGRGGTGR